MTDALLIESAYILSVAILLYAAARDILVRSVPNSASLAIIGIGLVVDLVHGSVIASLMIATLVLSVAITLWRLGMIGGADAKLIAATTLLLPPAHVPELLICIAFSGGLLSAFYLALRHLPVLVQQRTSATLLRRFRIEQRRSRRADALPYVVAICAGTLIALARG